MAKTNQNFEIYAGDDKEVTFTVYQENGTTVLNLTGYTANWVLYDEDETAILTKIIGDGLEIPTPSNGEVVLTLVPADTVNEDPYPALYNHELEVTSGAGKISTVTVGIVKISYSKA